jgi:hypothetical protein
MSEDMCQRLYDNNYDTDILDTLPVNVVDLWKKHAQTAFDTHPSTGINKALAVSVVNHFKGEQPVVRKISGIGGVTYMTNGDKKIYLFDDRTHSHAKTCVPVGLTITKYLEDIFKTADRFIDFYCEYGPKKIVFNNSYLSDVETTFRECTTGDSYILERGKCPANVRMHFIDIRSTQTLNPLVSFFEKRTLTFSDTDIERKKYIKEIDMHKIIISNKSEYDKFMKTQIDNNPYVQKELGRLDKKTRDSVLTYFFTYTYASIMNYIKPVGLSVLTTVEHAIKSRMKITTDDFIAFMRIAVIPYMFTMDIYFLCRMLKKYDISNNNTHPAYAKNIIVYVGSGHNKIYVDFLSKNGYKTVFAKTYINREASCLDISTMSQPLFSTNSTVQEDLIPQKITTSNTRRKILKTKITGPRTVNVPEKNQYIDSRGNRLYQLKIDGVIHRDFYAKISMNNTPKLRLLAAHAHLPNYDSMSRDHLAWELMFWYTFTRVPK